MKKSLRRIAFMSLVCLLLVLSACGGGNDPDSNASNPPPDDNSNNPSNPPPVYDPYAQYEGYLLQGYPEQMWPLYESKAISSCNLDVFFPGFNMNPGYVCTYNVVYYSEKPKAEIVAYYAGLAGSLNPSSFYDVDTDINNYHFTARVVEEGSRNLIYLAADMPDNFYTEHPLWGDFPSDVFPVFNLTQQRYHDVACRSNGDGELQYTNHYNFSGGRQAAVEYYRARLQNMAEYAETTNSDSTCTTLSGVVRGFDFQVLIYDDNIAVFLEKPFD
ncbi:MAG: hypothetical protein QQM50_01095 [Dehalococcoides mccartyi]|uniref:hypothetical protein n=1 Tax=Dehalococcoides TaxID=61434 RepID=UPI0019E8BB3B|nr:hypothetical protein [Dehalococcoides mccartyi]MBF4482060.1 hypothetical protein [Dehalococcoides mccartyi]MBJ7531416.1 hypothetical protein [Dehalococcoides mccartyi]MDP4279133.1 hypothetical protein [Dehalococcoides mccartyi]